VTVGESQYETHARAGLETQDWTSLVETAQLWVLDGGGASRPDPWLLRAAGQALNAQPRVAVHELDQGLRHWVEEPQDRALLLWARGSLQLRFLADPVGATKDFNSAALAAPRWMRRLLVRDQVACSAQACRSHQPTGTVGPAPAYDCSSAPHDAVAPPTGDRAPGDEPVLWEQLHEVLAPARR
jgi:hypothetical protein